MGKSRPRCSSQLPPSHAGLKYFPSSPSQLFLFHQPSKSSHIEVFIQHSDSSRPLESTMQLTHPSISTMSPISLPSSRNVTLHILYMLHVFLVLSLSVSMVTASFMRYSVGPSALAHDDGTLEWPIARDVVETRDTDTVRYVDDFTCPAADIAAGCKGAKDCMYAAPGDVHHYIQCSADGLAYLQSCPLARFIWNDEDKECNIDSQALPNAAQL